MRKAIKSTNFTFPGQTGKYEGKVREVYEFGDQLVMIASDRISAFDVVLPEPIPFKGQVLNQIAAKFLKGTADIVPNWLESAPDPNVSVGKRCQPFPVEMVIRGYLAGHAWREYKSGKRVLCGVDMPDGLKESDKLPHPIITPSTKATEGHDEDISREEILSQGLVKEHHYVQLEKYTQELFQRGSEVAAQRDLILVDTKYEFGLFDGTVYLIDEVHTPDSSRYFYNDTYAELQDKNEPQRQLSKEFVRQWLISEGFQGKDGQHIPEMTDDIIQSISNRYIELYEKITGDAFVKDLHTDIYDRMEQNILKSVNLDS